MSAGREVVVTRARLTREIPLLAPQHRPQDLDREPVDERKNAVGRSVHRPLAQLASVAGVVDVGREPHASADRHRAPQEHVPRSGTAADIERGLQIGHFVTGHRFPPTGEDCSAVDRPESGHPVQVGRDQVHHALAPLLELRALNGEGKNRDPGGGPLGDRLLGAEGPTAVLDQDVETSQAEQQGKGEHAARHGPAPREVGQLAPGHRLCQALEIDRPSPGQLSGGGLHHGPVLRLHPCRRRDHDEPDQEEDARCRQGPSRKVEGVDDHAGEHEDRDRGDQIDRQRADHLASPYAFPEARASLRGGQEELLDDVIGDSRQGVEPQLPRNTLERVPTAVLELEVRAPLRLPDRGRDEHLAGPRLGRHPGADVDGDPSHAAVRAFDLAHVDAAADLEPDFLHLVADGGGADDGPRRIVEHRQEAVARSGDLLAAEAAELRPDDDVVLAQDLPPPPVPEGGGLLGGADDVGEEGCRDRTTRHDPQIIHSTWSDVQTRPPLSCEREAPVSFQRLVARFASCRCQRPSCSRDRYCARPSVPDRRGLPRHASRANRVVAHAISVDTGTRWTCLT